MSSQASKEDEAVQAEFANQREYMERALDALKTRVGRTEHQTRQDFQRKVSTELLGAHRKGGARVWVRRCWRATERTDAAPPLLVGSMSGFDGGVSRGVDSGQ